MNKDNVNVYLNRINYTGNLTPSALTLRDLQSAHLYAVPFENLSIHHDEPIVLNEDDLFNKIVERKRGGFCYEVNGLFAALLRSLGFQVDKISARVANGDGSFSQPFDHMALLVTLEEPWLVDVGFGDTFREPLRLDSVDRQAQHGRHYRIQSEDDTFTMWEKKAGQDWQPQYRFRSRPYQFPDYEVMCHYHQTSPDSHFTQKRICSLATADGRVTLSDMLFIRTTLAGKRQESKVSNHAEYTQLLQNHFGIILG